MIGKPKADKLAKPVYHKQSTPDPTPEFYPVSSSVELRFNQDKYRALIHSKCYIIINFIIHHSIHNV